MLMLMLITVRCFVAAVGCCCGVVVVVVVVIVFSVLLFLLLLLTLFPSSFADVDVSLRLLGPVVDHDAQQSAISLGLVGRSLSHASPPGI